MLPLLALLACRCGDRHGLSDTSPDTSVDDVEGEGVVAVTSDPSATSPAIAPTGDAWAVAWEQGGHVLWTTVSADGDVGEPVDVGEGEQPRIAASSEGVSVAYARPTGESTWDVLLDGDVVTAVTGGPSFDVARTDDGAVLATCDRPTATSATATTWRDGVATDLATMDTEACPVALTWDGASLWFATAASVFDAESASAVVLRRLGPDGRPADDVVTLSYEAMNATVLSVDGPRVVWNRVNGGIWTAPLAADGTLATYPVELTDDLYADVAVAGDDLAYVPGGRTCDGDDCDGYEVVRVRLDGTEESLGYGRGADAAIASSGDTVAVAYADDGIRVRRLR